MKTQTCKKLFFLNKNKNPYSSCGSPSQEVVPLVRIYDTTVHQNSDAQQESKVQFVPFKKTSAYVAVQTEGEVVINNFHSLIDIT